MTPWETVLASYRFPEKIGLNVFEPERLQIEVINDLAPLPRSGLYLDMGTGKTFVATACSLYHRVTLGHRVVVVMPPLLMNQWARWLDMISPELSVTMYRGTPVQRAKLSLDVDFVLVGVQIFKLDYTRFRREYDGRALTVLMDEANYLTNINSDTHQKLHEFTQGLHVMLLTGTPANTPADVYALTKFTSPGTYRSKRQYENLHVDKVDFYGKPLTWLNLELAQENLMLNSRRVLYSDMYGDIETPIYDSVEYRLSDEHQKLYRKLAKDEMLKVKEGKIDATNANKLRHALGQIIVNYAHFSGVPTNKSNAIEMILGKLQELGQGKLVIFVHYRLTVRHLTEQLRDFGAVPINSEVSNADKDLNVQRFINDETCRVIVIQYVSGGKGLDGLQAVCHTAMCIEPCQQPRDFHQAVARLQRKGQRKRVHVIMPIARRTLQVDGFKALIDNDTLVNQVVRNATDLRREIFGGEE